MYKTSKYNNFTEKRTGGFFVSSWSCVDNTFSSFSIMGGILISFMLQTDCCRFLFERLEKEKQILVHFLDNGLRHLYFFNLKKP